MIYGVGVDILDLKHIRALAPDWDDPFFIKTFTENERREAVRREDPVRCFGGRFSGKEAVFKALRISSDAIRLDEIEILSDSENRPYVNLLGRAKQIAEQSGIGKISVSLSNEGDLAVAFAICESNK